MTSFSERLVSAVLSCTVTDSETRRLATRAIADTLCVAAPGFFEPVTKNALSAYAGSGAVVWSGMSCESWEAAVMINAIAAHALDFDDVYLESLAHASAVIVPAIATEASGGRDPNHVIDAFCAGMIAAHAVARRLGQDHYNRGWHGTGTVGAFAAAAAVGRLFKISHEQMAAAFALCASMSGGLRLNFGTQGKAAHAGFAVVAGLRAVRLARAGVNGAPDIFARNGFIDLYGGSDGVDMPDDDAFIAHPERVSLKLYPCCYAAHRLIGAALDVRALLGGALAAREDLRFVLTGPVGSLDVLKYDRPKTAIEAKFSGPFNIAVAMLDGVPTLQSYSAEAVRRNDIASVMNRIAIVEDETQRSGGDIEFGKVKLEVLDGDNAIQCVERSAIPGSPDDPPSQDALRQKLRGCVMKFEEQAGRPFPGVACLRQLEAQHWL